MEEVFKYDHVQRRAAFGAGSSSHKHTHRLVPSAMSLWPACGAHTWGSVLFMPFVETDLKS